MKAPTDKNFYPIFKQSETALYAFTSPSEMYLLHARGSNKNPGFTVDMYITRRMVIEHFNKGHEITKERFKERCESMFKAIVDKIVY